MGTKRPAASTAWSTPRGATNVASYTYTLDENGNRRSMTSAAGTETYTLDDIDQLIGASLPGQSLAFTYDAGGNRNTSTVNGATTTYTYDDASRLVSAGPTTYSYDRSGNRVTAGAASFTWNDFARLSRSVVGGTTTDYRTDGDGRRVASVTGGATTPYLWDEASSLEQLVGEATRTYLYADAALLAESATGSSAYPLGDALGSIRVLTDGSGSATGRVDYDPFGVVTSQTGATSRMGFTGAQTDATGLVFLRSRISIPRTGAFLSTDPRRPGAAGAVGYNQYTYVGSNPTTLVDPTGELAETGLLTATQQRAAAVTATGIGIGIRLRLLLVAAALTCASGICEFVGTLPWTGLGDPPTTLPEQTMGQVEDTVQTRLQTRVGPITADIAKSIVWSVCVQTPTGRRWRPGESLRRGYDADLRDGRRLLEVSTHDLGAIAGHASWAQLNYGPNAFPQGWYRQVQYGSVCIPDARSGDDCHEFPYYSTTQAGPGANVQRRDAGQNREQGRRLYAFYNTQCHVSTSPTGAFGVLPSPIPGVPTGGLCK